MFDRPNAEVWPCWSCQKTGSEASTLMCHAKGTKRSGAAMTGQGRITLPARTHPAATRKATGKMKITDS